VLRQVLQSAPRPQVLREVVWLLRQGLRGSLLRRSEGLCGSGSLLCGCRSELLREVLQGSLLQRALLPRPQVPRLLRKGFWLLRRPEGLCGSGSLLCGSGLLCSS
jgi:hypothetical protein